MLTTKWILKRLNFPGDIILLGQEEYTIGRGKDNYHSVLSIFVSRRHCLFRVIEGNLVVKDLNSSNGTFINESKIPPNKDIILRDHDCIGIGVPIAGGSDHYVYSLLKEGDPCNKIANDDARILKPDLAKEQNKPLNSKALESEDDEESDVLLIENKAVDIIDLSDDEEKEKGRVSAVGSSSAAPCKQPSRNTSCVLGDADASSSAAVQKTRAANPCSKDKCSSNFDSTETSDSVFKSTSKQSENIQQRKENRVYLSNKSDANVNRNYYVCKVKREPKEQSFSEVEKSHCEKRGLNVSSNICQNVVKIEKPSGVEMGGSFGGSLQANPTLNNAITARLSSNVSKKADSNSRCGVHSSAKTIRCSSTVFPVDLETTISVVADKDIQIKQEKSSFDSETTESGVCVHSKSSESTLLHGEAKKRSSNLNPVRPGTELLNIDVRSDQLTSKVKIEKSSPGAEVDGGNIRKSIHQNLTSSDSSKVASNSNIPAEITVKKEKAIDDTCADSVRKNVCENIEEIVGRQSQTQPKQVSSLRTSTIEKSSEAEVMKKSRSSKLVQNVSESVKQKNSEREIEVPVLSERTEKHKQNLKRPHEISTLVPPRTNLNDSSDPVSKRTKFGPVISRNLSNNSSRSSSPCSSHTESSNSSSTSLLSEDVDNNPDKWFAKVSVPFLDQLEKTLSAKTDGSNSSCHSKRKTTENFVANVPESKMKKTKSKLKSKKTYYIKDVDPLPRYLDPIVVVEKLDLKKVNVNSMSRSSSCDSLFEEAMQVLESIRNLNDTSPLSNTPSQSTSLNYSQIDDVVVIDDDTDEDDQMNDISTNKADKNSNNDEFKDDGEEVVVKQEIFDDDYEDQIDNDDGDDDDDEVQLVNEWVCKLSQSSQLLEDDVILSGREENKRLFSVSSDSSDEEIPKSTEQEQPNIGDKTNDRMNIIFLSDVSEETDEEIFDLKGMKSKKNETSHGKHFASSNDKDGSISKNKKTDKYKSYFSFSSDKGEIDDAIFKLPGNIDVESSSDDEIFPSKTTKTKNDKVFASEKNVMSYNDSDECELRNKTKTSHLVEDKNEGESYRHSSFSTKISEENAQDISKHSAYNDNEIYSHQKSSLHQKKDVQKSSVKEPFGTEVTLEEYAEKLLDSAFTAQKDKTDGKSDDKRNKSAGSSTNERSNNTKKHSTSSTQPSNRRTLMCSALPIAPRSRSKTGTEKADRHKTLTADSVKAKSNKNEMSHRTTTTHVKSRSHDYKSKSPEMKINDNYPSEREKLDKVREERKAKLKALTAQKAEATSSKEDSRVPVKPSYRAKNTASSRADKLTESFVSSKTSGSKSEKIKVRVVQKKSDADKSSANHLQHSSNKKAPQTDNIEKQLPATKNTGVVPSEAFCDAHLEDTSVPEIEKQIKNLSLKNDYRIPKLKFTTPLPAETRTSISGSVKENKITKKPSKAPPKKIPLRPAIRNVMTSYPKKTVHFAPAESLCTVQSFHIEDGNSLHRIEGKDAPVRKALAHQAEALYDSSQNVLNRVISAILKTWNPRWFQEEKIVAQKGGEPPPAHCESTPVSSLCPMLTSFTSYEEYLKIVHPLMLLDLWARISEDANKPNQRAKEKYEISVGEKKDVNGLLVLSCAMPISVRQDREGLYPRVGDLCTIRCPIWDPEQDNVHNTQRPHQEKHLERFAYIESMTRDFRSVNDSTWRQGNLKKFTGPVHAVLHFVIKLKGDKRLNFVNLSLKVISCIRSELRMFEAVGYLERTRLCKMILSPCVSDYKLPRANAEMQLTSRDILLNVSQRTAVFQCSSICLHSAPKLCLVQGPPGTGKTKVIINIIQQILYPNGQYSKQRWDKKTRILLCAPSNAAADEMAERLLAIRAEMQKDRFKMVRIGPLESMRESVRGVSLDELAKKEVEASVAHQMSLESVEVEIATLEARRRSYVMACEHASSKKENTAMYEKRIQEVERRLAQLKSPLRNVPSHKTSELEREARKKLLSYADIIVSTLSSSFNPQMTEVFASRNGRSIARFTCCIIDEATQSKEPECLIPLMYGIEKIVLVGDPEQLPATVISQVAKEKSFGQSLFNRIWNKFQNEADNPVIFLNIQYRMHPDIYHWPNTYIYHGKVISDYNFHSILKPYCLFAHKYQQHSTSFVNSNEAILVSDVAKAVASRFSNCVKTIGIITPYQRQLQEIRNHIDGSRPHPVTIVVNTIDGFQGRECDIIIFSCVRTRGVGFMCESQRLNVALTRARHSLIICGNFVSLQGDRMWASLLGDAMQRRVVVDTHNVIFSQADIVNQLLKPT